MKNRRNEKTLKILTIVLSLVLMSVVGCGKDEETDPVVSLGIVLGYQMVQEYEANMTPCSNTMSGAPELTAPITSGEVYSRVADGGFCLYKLTVPESGNYTLSVGPERSYPWIDIYLDHENDDTLSFFEYWDFPSSEGGGTNIIANFSTTSTYRYLKVNADCGSFWSDEGDLVTYDDCIFRISFAK